MTTADMPWRQGKHPLFDRIATRLAHWTPLLVLAAGAAMIGVPLAAPSGPWWWSVLVALAALFLMVAFMMLAAVITDWHVYGLCRVCARKVPLDPAQAVARKRRRLALMHWCGEHHRTTNRAVLAVYLLGVIVSLGSVFLASPALALLSVAPIAAIFVWLAFETYLATVHLPLQPWCPQCRGGWGKGGRPEVVPDPDPVGADEKVS